MPVVTLTLEIPLDGTGTEIPALNTTDPYGAYLITGTAIAIGNYAIVPTGTPTLGLTYCFRYNGSLDITTNSKTFSLFGKAFNQTQLSSKWKAICYYDGSAWDVVLDMSFAESDILTSANIGSIISGSNIPNNSIDLSTKAQNTSLTNNKIAANTIDAHQKLVALSVTDAEINDVDGSKLAAASVANSKLATMPDMTVKANVSGGVAVPTNVDACTLAALCSWSLTGNAGTIAGTNFLGTTDAIDLVFKVNNIEAGRLNLANYNVSFGQNALASNLTGATNIAIGDSAMTSNTSGSSNVAVGSGALSSLLSSGGNVAVGESSLSNVTTGLDNIGVGQQTANTLTTGSNNTIIGADANVSSASSVNRIALGKNATASADYQFAIPDDVTTIKFKGIVYTLPTVNAAGVLTNDGAGNLTWV